MRFLLSCFIAILFFNVSAQDYTSEILLDNAKNMGELGEFFLKCFGHGGTVSAEERFLKDLYLRRVKGLASHSLRRGVHNALPTMQQTEAASWTAARWKAIRETTGE